MKKIEFKNDTLSRLHTHLQSTYPNEGVGFLFGLENDSREIIDALPVNNTKEGDQRRRFEVAGLDYIKAEKHATESGLLLLGLYHSHPDHPAIPSEHDLRSAVPYFSYVIVSLIKGEVADTTSWQLDDNGKFKQEIINNQIIENAL